MSTILGILGLADRDTTIDTVGQRAVYDAVNELARRQEEEMNAAYEVFVQETTTAFKEVYKLPGGGEMQESTTLTRPAAVKPNAGWEVAYPIADLRDQIAWDDVSRAYMSVGDLDAA